MSTASTSWPKRACCPSPPSTSMIRHQVEVRQQVWLQGIAGRRHPPRHRRHDGRQGRRGLRLWRRRQGFGRLAGRAGARVKVTEIDPICALQAAMDATKSSGSRTSSPRQTSSSPPPANKDVITIDHMREMKDMALSAISATSTTRSRLPRAEPEVDQHQAAGRHDRVPQGNRMILLSEGRLLNLGNATGHPSFVMSASFTNQVLGQIELYTTRASTRIRSMCCQAPRRKGRPPASGKARRPPDRTQRQPGRLHQCRKVRPFKSEHYRY